MTSPGLASKMIISADVIEGTETTDNTGAEASTSEQAQVSPPKKKISVQRNHVLNVCKSLNKLSGDKTKITWKYFLTEVLKLDSDEIPSNTVLIAKLNDLSADNERELYSVLSNEKDFRAIKKFAKEKKCSFSVIVKYMKNEVFDKKNAQKIIDDLLKPNSVHVSVTVLGRNYSPKSIVSSKSVEKVQMPSNVNQKLTEMRESLSLICKNLEELEINIESSNNNDLVEKNALSEPLDSDNEPQSTTSPSTSIFELSQASTQNLDGGLDLKSTAINSNDNSTEETSEITINENNENPYSSLSSPFDVEAGAKIAKIWKIRNNGSARWTSNLTLRCTAGNINPVPEHCTSIPVPLLKPGEEDYIKINFKVPTNLRPGSSIFSVWRFCYKGKTFGTPLNLNAAIKPSGYKPEKPQKPSSDMPLIDLKAGTNDIIEFPQCFDLNVPFVKSGEVKLPSRVQEIFAESDSIKSTPVCKSHVSANEPASARLLPSTSSGKSLSPGKSKTIAKKLELIESRRVCHAKKRQLKTAKQCSGQLAKASNHVPIPVPSSSIVEKIKCKNAANHAKINDPIGHCDAARKGSFISEAHKKNCSGKTPISNSEPASSESKRSYGSSASFSNPLQGSLEPTLNLVGQTFSSIYNMFAIPGTSANSQEEGENKQSNTNLKGSNELLQSTLQKLSEMGFCNKKLNVELLIKNNLDIQRTVQELLSSIGNIVSSPGTTSDTNSNNTATATSASPSPSTGSTKTAATGSNSSPPKEKAKASKSSFSVDSVD